MRDKLGGYTKAELQDELYDLRARALKYEQALRFVIAEAHRGMDSGLDTSEMFYALHVICRNASAALDKPMEGK